MKKSKRLLALLLSVMLIIGAVMSVPFTASAKEAEIAETGAYSLRFNTLNILGGQVAVDKDYYTLFDTNATDSEPLYAVLDTEEAGYYVLYARNNNLTAGSKTLTIGIVSEDESFDHSMGLANGEESELSVRLNADTRYYIKLCYTYEEACYGGIMDLRLSYFADAEPDEMEPAISITSGETYEGSIDVAEDKDWIFVSAVSNKKHSITIENLNEEATAFQAEVYDTNNNLLGTVVTETENSVTLELAKPSDVVSYYICVTGINTNVRGNYSIKMEEILPVSVEVPLNEEYYDTIAGFGKEGGRDYLKFTTIDKDAYYTIYVKNIDIETHSWAADNAVQVEILNANSEEIGRIRLLPASEGAVTLKLQPDTTYYMQVYNNYLPDTKGGNYKVQISYVLDPDKNEMENATDWTLEEKYYGDIAARGDMDWFKITTDEDTDYTFTLKNINIPTHSWSADLRFRGVIYNDKNESLATLMMFSGEELNTRVTLDPNTTYYIAIWDPEGTTGDYSFDLSVTVIIDEEAVGMANAVELKYGEEHYDSITNWDGENKFDYLKFTTLSEPAYYTITAKNINIPTHSWSSDYQVQVKILNEHKEELGKITLSEGSEGSATLSLEENTTYYIRINNNENNGGNYKALVTYVLDPEANVMESGKTLRIGERYYSSIAANGDVDFFKVTTDEETEFTLVLKNISLETHSWSTENVFRAILMNKYSETLGEVVCRTGEENSLKFELDANTTYYIKVVDPWNTKGDYSLMFAKSMVLGDTNLDGNVKIQDATLIQKALAKLVTLDAKQNTLADATEDGKVNIKDATAIQKHIAKVEIPYRVGELILVEQEYSEPAEEETVALDTAPTTAASEPAEAPVTTTATATDATEAPVTTTATEPTEEPVTTTVPITTEAAESLPNEATEATETTAPAEPKTKIEELKELVELCENLAGDSSEYENEAPLTEGGAEIAQKADFGFDLSKEEVYLNEYYKFHRAFDIYSYNLFRGIKYTEEESAEILLELEPAYNWFAYYVTEVHPTPSGRVIYFRNTENLSNIQVYYWNDDDSDVLWPGEAMEPFAYAGTEQVFSYEIPYGYDRICFTFGLDGYTEEIDLNIALEAGFCVTSGSTESGSADTVYQWQNFYYEPFRLDL